jgi:hypothetical protein
MHARERALHPDALVVQVPQGPGLPGELHPGAALRAATVPEQPLDKVAAVWAASPAVADAVVARGFPAERVAWFPPAIAPVATAGPGDGILAMLPTHDLHACAAPLAALARLASVPVRVLPTVRSAAVEQLIAERLPGAELLAPCTDERRLAALAATSEVALAADPSDVFERRALTAAAAGCAIVAVTRGPAAAVLGDGVVAHSAGGLDAALERALADAGDRAGRAARLRESCDPSAVTRRIGELLADLPRLREELARRFSAERAVAAAG